MNSNSLIGIISLILIVVLAQSVVIVKDTEKAILLKLYNMYLKTKQFSQECKQCFKI